MRRRIGRAFVAVTVVTALALAAPAQAMARSEEPGPGWVFRGRDKIVKVIRTTIRSFGDGLSDPKPKP